MTKATLVSPCGPNSGKFEVSIIGCRRFAP